MKLTGLKGAVGGAAGAGMEAEVGVKNKTSDELFALYDAELILKVHNTRNLENDRRSLAKLFKCRLFLLNFRLLRF